MAEAVLLDNDVVLKVCAYRCHVETVAITSCQEVLPAILSIARFTLRSRLAGKNQLTEPKSAAEALEQLLGAVTLIEPTDAEIAFAAELEELASAKGLEFDVGESQLVAILLSRGSPLLITGDKRAVNALAKLGVPDVEGRLVCFEQLLTKLLDVVPFEELRRRVCAEPTADKATTACFACSASTVAPEDILAGLQSYTNHLRKGTGELLSAVIGTVVP